MFVDHKIRLNVILKNHVDEVWFFASLPSKNVIYIIEDLFFVYIYYTLQYLQCLNNFASIIIIA